MDLSNSDAELIYTTGPGGKLCELTAQLTATCHNETSLKDANITLKSVNCTLQANSTAATMETFTTSIQPSITQVEITTQPICKCQAARSVASIGLGALVGLLMILLAVVTIGWMWTCWIMRKRARIITTSTRDIR